MRIVSLVPSVTETLFELGLEDQIVGITDFCILPTGRVDAKPKIGGSKTPDISKIVALHPDIVIVNEEENRKEDADALRHHGIELMVTYPNSIDEAAQMVNDLGERFHSENRAESMAGEIRDRKESIQPERQRTTLILVWRNPYITINETTYVHDVCHLFGLQNVFADSSDRYPRLNPDQIRKGDPEAVLFPDEPFPFAKKHVSEFAATIPEIRAVRGAKLLIFPGVYVTWHGYGTLRMLREFPPVLQDAGLWS